ncbi:MAG: pyridoxamine 5'-phosphate oxidase family protein [Anaerolineae bacterium]|nr:pyridoxamine 5'-phosphate oxidase family protein [Anaerolineae bacterium]MCO5189403.1 pyridoxamine 5'-phosphate oxidase family protein [Anaerolineae bacterium]MCO5192556.1 pyridoxamine 5'-phosphate oxidase family protein [Anaerolineae bacterium]MCO5198719.1 pyridoxamine 5'-phosphate oxidase family protein [Anaerolineae bacterium]MCO5203608.1 pyridoxamine 5'-phosphate oxidase family protein [Anaerolineae bacterium]
MNDSSKQHPIVTRPHMPGYGVKPENEGDGLFDWAWVSDRMAQSRNYWICTTRPDGRPHATPVWGVWYEDTFYFGVGPESRKGRNLAVNPNIVVHLESGDEVVILEGVVHTVSDRGLLSRLAVRYNNKYKLTVYPEDGSGDSMLALQPAVAMAWLETDFPGTATRWQF